MAEPQPPIVVTPEDVAFLVRSVQDHATTETPPAPVIPAPYDPSQPYPIPDEKTFGAGDFLLASDLAQIGHDLLAEDGVGSVHLHGNVTFLWKRNGGLTGGRHRLGTCTKTTGLLQHFAHTAFVIWLAADHLRASNATLTHIKAALYHELSHASRTRGSWIIRPHDFEGFAEELRLYGPWTRGLELAIEAAADVPAQLPLDL